ncbi:MAG: isoaspartyl peptidase/L-asparaginase [Pseudomonadota bacterium]
MKNPILACDDSTRFALVVHGGAYWGAEPGAARRGILREVSERAGAWLKGGAPALSVVEEIVVLLEDSGHFNAGRGSIPNLAGDIEMDAAIMDGRTLDTGAIATVSRLKNPIRGARGVMKWTPHVLLSGPSAEDFMAGIGLETVAQEYFHRAKPKPGFEEKGTVGAVALDRCGNLAAAASTGGFTGKMAGRIGDTPIPGAGLFAENGVVAVASTGHGESFLKTVLAHEVAARMKFARQPLAEAARRAIFETLEAVSGEGGLIAVDSSGQTVSVHNSDGMLVEVVTWETLEANED